MFVGLGALAFGSIIECSEITRAVGSIDLDAIEVEICKKIPAEYEDVRIKIGKISSSGKVEIASSVEVSLGEPLMGKARLVMKTFDAKGGVSLQTANVTIEAYKIVWIFNRDMRAGEVLQDQDVFKQKVNFSPFWGVHNSSSLSPVGQRLVKHYKKGQIVFQDYLMSPVSAMKNDQVKAILIENGLKIQMDAIVIDVINSREQKMKIRLVATGAILIGVRRGDTVYVEN